MTLFLSLRKQVSPSSSAAPVVVQPAPTSPTKSYLTQFPVVQQQPPAPQQQGPSEKKSSSSITQQHVAQAKVSHSSTTSSNEATRRQTNQSKTSKETSRQVSPASGSSKMMNTSSNQLAAATNQSYHVGPGPQTRANPDYSYGQNYPDFSRHQNYVKMPGNSRHQIQVQNQSQMAMFNEHQYPSYDVQSDTFFSVNQLVNPSKMTPQFMGPSNPSASAKKASKRSSSSTSTNTSSRYAKQPRVASTASTEAVKISENNGKKEERKASSKSQKPSNSNSTRSLTLPTASIQPPNSNSASRSSNKRSYTAESLFIQDVQPASNLQPLPPVSSANPNQSLQSSSSNRHHHYSPHHHHSTHRSQTEKTQNRLPELNWNDTSGSTSNHFASFPSISPSPNLFSQDFANFDFPSSMFNTTPEMASSTSGGQAGSGNNKNLQQNQHQRNQMLHQDYVHSVHDQQLFDANFFTSGNASTGNTGALTPPSIYHHQTQDSHHVHEGYGSNFARNYKTSSRIPSQNQMQIQTGSQQMMTGNDLQAYAGSQGGSSYVNFNLSTIFPEINVTASSDKIASLLPPVPSTLRTSASSSTATPVVSSSATSASDFRTSTTDILPHSIAIFGAGHPPPAPHQMSFGSFAATSFSTTVSATSGINNFSLNE